MGTYLAVCIRLLQSVRPDTRESGSHVCTYTPLRAQQYNAIGRLGLSTMYTIFYAL